MTTPWTPSFEFLIENSWGGALEFPFLTHFRVYIWSRDHIFRATGLQFFGEPHMQDQDSSTWCIQIYLVLTSPFRPWKQPGSEATLDKVQPRGALSSC